MSYRSDQKGANVPPGLEPYHYHLQPIVAIRDHVRGARFQSCTVILYPKDAKQGRQLQDKYWNSGFDDVLIDQGGTYSLPYTLYPKASTYSSVPDAR